MSSSPNSAGGQASAGNVIAAICSFFVPGLGQLVQGRILAALLMFVLAGVVWFVSLGMLGWVMHLVACIEAARWKRR
jgi:TM2 domain-containing membrane protein YozV